MIRRYRSPFGVITYELREGRCTHLWLGDRAEAKEVREPDEVCLWLEAYFHDGILRPLPPLGLPATPFQARLRQALLEIPRGEVRTYAEVARRLGTAPRALGQALAANPLPLLIPCHRVVAKDGVGGFSCGIDWKIRLLQLEGGWEKTPCLKLPSRDHMVIAWKS